MVYVCVCVCVRDCYAFHSVCVMPPVKLACARGSEIRSERQGSDQLAERKDDHLLKTPTRDDTQRSAQLRNTETQKVLSDISCLTINISASDPNRSSFLDCNNQLDHTLELSVISSIETSTNA